MGNRFREKEVEEELVVKDEIVEPEVEEEEVSSEEDVKTEERKSERRDGKVVKGIGQVIGGKVIADKVVLRQIPLILLCFFYLLLLVGNRYVVESLSREKMASKERISYLREHHIRMQKEYQQTVKISQIAETLKDKGVGLTAGPPYEL